MSKEIRYLGIDWGEERIGLSLGDNVLKIATPHGVASSLNDVLRLVKEEGIDEIVLGEPVKMKNLDKNFHDSYFSFKKKLEDSLGLKINLYDERLSSKAADALLGDRKTKAPRDAIAAMIILQGFLDKKEE